MARHTCVQATWKSELIFNSEIAQSRQAHDISYLSASLPKVSSLLCAPLGFFDGITCC